MRPAIAIAPAMALLLAACGTTGGLKPAEPRIVVQEVKVPVPVPCEIVLPPRPNFVNTDALLAAAVDAFERADRLKKGRAQDKAWIATLEAGLASCTAPP